MKEMTEVFSYKNFKKLIDAKVHFICYDKIRNPIITKKHKLNKNNCLHVYRMCTNVYLCVLF